ncbi:DUF4386 domain-containing protein [Marinicrinis sediminis]|uniref:DUF4386 domain-containing protein n=1 Tax=Marinicrinis sediminis TaxID=1652465 RepID=A0ABW5RC15_9BACL
MTIQGGKSDQREQDRHGTAAVVAGGALLIMAVAAFFSYGYVHNSLIDQGDPLHTLQQMEASATLFRMEILGWLLIILCDLLVSWGLYQYFKPIHAAYAVLTGWLRLLYTAILSIAVAQLVVVSSVVEETRSGFGGTMEEWAMQVWLSITAFESIWSMGLIIFGLHLIVAGLVALRAVHIPKWIGSLLILAGISYTLINLMYRIVPELESVTAILEMILMAPMMIGELGFAIWLLLRGHKQGSKQDHSKVISKATNRD